MKINEIMDMDENYYMGTFGKRTPVSFEYGKGIKLWDTEGKMYYDFLGGIAVNALGHAHPKLVSAITEQAGKLMHCSNLYYIENQSKLAKTLVENSCADKVFFANSGAEANEGAIKLARIYFKKAGQPQKYEIITLKKSFHGRTMTTLAATGQEKYHKPFEPIPTGFRHVTINDASELEAAIGEHTCAIMLEAIQGEGGVNLVSPEYAQKVREICGKHDLLLIFDEVQTGIGRTGKLFGYQQLGVEPDIFTLAKALGGGFPIGAVCAKEHVAQAFGKGDHGSTFGGNPLACAAGLAVMETIFAEGLVENADSMGKYFKDKLAGLSKRTGLIAEVRGKGLMIGIQLSSDCAGQLKALLFEKGYLVGDIGGSILRLLPPLIITQGDIDGFVDTLGECIQQISI